MLISLALRDPNWCQVSSGPLRNLSKGVAMRKCCDLQALADEVRHSQRLARKDTTGSTTLVRCLSRWWAPREADNPRKLVQKTAKLQQVCGTGILQNQRLPKCNEQVQQDGPQAPNRATAQLLLLFLGELPLTPVSCGGPSVGRGTPPRIGV
jgi:hypothetical protein